MVDLNYRFVWGSCGYPGNSHDAIIFKSTNLWNSIQHGLLPSIGKSVGEVNVPPLRLSSWYMTHGAYTNAVLSPQQRSFNFRLSRARMVTEGAYAQLKGRWRVLCRKTKVTRNMATQQHAHVWYYKMYVSCKQTPFQESLTYHLVQMAKRKQTGMKSGDFYS